MTVSDLVLIIPMLRRAHRVGPLIASIEQATPRPHRLLFVATEEDDAVIDTIKSHGADLLVIRANVIGDYAKKINYGYRNSTEPLMFLGADDLHFHPGWFEAAVAEMDKPGIGVVGTQDLANHRVIRGEHATHSLVSRDYIDQWGTIDEARKVLHEKYRHEFVDDELVQTAKRRNAFAFAHHSIVEHLHPLVGKAPVDEMYAAQRERMRIDSRVFRRRQRLWK